MLRGQRGSCRAIRIAHAKGRGILLEEPCQRDREEVFVTLKPRLGKNGIEPLVLQRLNSGSRQRKSQEPTEVSVKRAGKCVSLEKPNGFFHDRTQALLFDEKAPLQTVEEEERITDVMKGFHAAGREPAEVVRSLVWASLAYTG